MKGKGMTERERRGMEGDGKGGEGKGGEEM